MTNGGWVRCFVQQKWIRRWLDLNRQPEERSVSSLPLDVALFLIGTPEPVAQPPRPVVYPPFEQTPQHTALTLPHRILTYLKSFNSKKKLKHCSHQWEILLDNRTSTICKIYAKKDIVYLQTPFLLDIIIYVKKMYSYNFSFYLGCVLLIEQSEDIVLTWEFRNLTTWLSDNYGAFDDFHDILNLHTWYKDKAKYE